MPPLKLFDHQRKMLAVAASTPAPGRYAVSNALNHLRAGWRVRKVDPAMAVFRGITANEESATAVFHALKQRKYKGAEILKVRRHDHKAATIPFLDAVEHALSGLMAHEPNIVLRKPASKPPRIRLRFHAVGADGQRYNVEPEPPLHGIMTANNIRSDFGFELGQLVTRQPANSMLEVIRDTANERNRLLYASSSGIPAVSELKDEFFIRERRRVFRNIGIYLFIEYPEHQDFVQQALDAFLKMLGRLPSSGD
jgi:hypothetical protein